MFARAKSVTTATAVSTTKVIGVVSVVLGGMDYIANSKVSKWLTQHLYQNNNNNDFNNINNIINNNRSLIGLVMVV